ncbi:GNAT family N-acetyltransferase [Oxalobacteraceae bacterium]|nr:GNAT family N-acetyltransferase [Oxalobacteraceae bacterium]
MKAKPGMKALKVGAYVLATLLLLCAANYLAGVLLFLSFLEHPADAQFLTIEHAYLAHPDGATLMRLKVSVVVSLLVCLGLPLALRLRFRSKGSDLYGKARFADIDDIEQENLHTSKGLVIGKFEDQLLRLGGYEFVLLAAPTRTGKGVGFCVPNLLQFGESAVVLDIKGENYNLTSEFRRRFLGNEIFYFNPFAENTHRWNPLSYISTDLNFRANDLMALASIIYPVNEKDPFWSDASKNLFVGLGLLVLETPELPQTIGEVLRQSSSKGQPISTYLNAIIAARAADGRPLSPACRDSLNRFLGNSETTLKSILGTFTAPLTPWGNPIIDKATSDNDFDLRDVRKKKMTIYLHIPAGEIMQAGFIVNLFFSQLINENVKELPEQNPALKYQCLLLLDEFTAMGKVAIIAKGVGYMAGYNMRLAIIIQDKTQLEAVYGKEDAHNIVSNMGAVIYFTPSQVSEAEEYSKMIGNNTVKSSSMQLAKGVLGSLQGSAGASETESYQSRALMLPQELLNMSKNLQLVVRSGIPVIQAGKIRYFQDEYFKERFNAVKMHEVTIGSERRRVPVPVRLPSGNWPAYHASLEASDFYLGYIQQVAPAEAAPAEKRVDLAKAAQPVNAAPVNAAPLPALPADYEPFCTLHGRLLPDAALPSPSMRIALSYAESIVRYWQAAQAVGGVDADEALVVVDLAPGDGRFASKMLSALQERLASMAQPLPPFHYLACTADAREEANLNALFSAPILAGAFRTVDRATLLAGQDWTASANPAVLIAHGLLSSLEHQLLAVHYGAILQAQAKAVAQPASNAGMLQLDYQWPPLPEGVLSDSSAAVMDMYRANVNSSAVLLPSGALACVDDFSRISGGRFLFLCADRAVSDERSIRLGACSGPEQLPLPAQTLPTNYHALAWHLRSAGAGVWQQRMADGDMHFSVALRDDAHEELLPALPEMLVPLEDVRHVGAECAVIAPPPNATALAECLALLLQSGCDPQAFEILFPAMQANDWSLSITAQEQWRDALARTWMNYLPRVEEQSIARNLSRLAMQVNHYGLAGAICRKVLDWTADDVNALYWLALCEAEAGRIEFAIGQLRLTTAWPAPPANCTTLLTTLEARLKSQQTLNWFRSELADAAPLRLEPLAEHHAESLHFQYRDPQIATMSMLPTMATLEQARTWISDRTASPGAMYCAIRHENWGLVGMVGLQTAGDSAALSFWIGSDHQGQGYGPLAADTLIRMGQAAGLRQIFAAAFAWDPRSSRVLAGIGLERLTWTAAQPHNDVAFFRLGAEKNEQQMHAEFGALCRAINSPYQLDALAMANIE